MKIEALQRAIFNSANFSCIATDASGVIQIFNVGAERMLGYPASEVINRITPAEISDPDEVIARAEALSIEQNARIAPGFEALVYKASRGIEDIYELTYLRKDGSRLPALVSVTALRDGEDVVIGYLLIGTDNTARKQAESALRESEAKFRTMVTAVPQMVWITRADGWNVYFSQKWMDYTGLTLEESLGHGWNKPFHPDDQQLAWKAWQLATATSDGTYRLEARLRRADGVYRWFLILGVRQLDFDGTTLKWFGTCTDITQAKESEEKLLEATEQAELANRAKTVLLQEIHHRVKNSLAVTASLLSMKADTSPPEAKLALEESQQRVHSIALAHEHLYAAERLDRIDFGGYARELAEGVFSAFTSEQGNVALHLELDPIEVAIQIAVPCALILNELLTNAFKYAFADGRAGRIMVSLREPEAGRCEMTVQDDGVGLAPGVLGGQDKSLGLRMVKILTDQIEGSIEQSDCSPGTRIVLHFTPTLAYAVPKHERD